MQAQNANKPERKEKNEKRKGNTMRNTAGQKKLDSLKSHVLSGNTSMYAGSKRKFKAKSKAFLKQLSKDVRADLTREHGKKTVYSKISFSSGSFTIEGSASLAFITVDSKCLLIQVNGLIHHLLLWDCIGEKGNGNMPLDTPYEEIVSQIVEIAAEKVSSTWLTPEPCAV